jgi:hypothetical protein
MTHFKLGWLASTTNLVQFKNILNTEILGKSNNRITFQPINNIVPSIYVGLYKADTSKTFSLKAFNIT